MCRAPCHWNMRQANARLSRTMTNTQSIQDGRVVSRKMTGAEQPDVDALWVDLVDPSAEERDGVREVYGQELPTMESMVEIEATSRFFEDDQGVHLRSYFLQEFPDGAVNVTVAFVFNGGPLFTLRPGELAAFDDFSRNAAHRPDAITDPYAVALGLFEAQVDRIADVLERLYGELGADSKAVFGVDEKDMEEVVTRLAAADDVNGKVRLSLMDKQRALSFLMRSGKLADDHGSLLKEIMRDIDSLIAHAISLFEKINFLMDVTMGKIPIKQNKIIKILSIAAVVFLPPTLIARVYGMNFHDMPELSWRVGYPAAIVLMVISSVAPYWFFKRKGWL